MLSLIIILIVLFVSWSIYKDFRKQRNNTNAQVSTINDASSLRIRKRHERLIRREERRKRHNRVWSVLFLINSFHEIEAQDVPTKKMIANLESAKRTVTENHPTQEDIETAIRFCKIENIRGKCSHILTQTEIVDIHNIYALAAQPPLPPR